MCVGHKVHGLTKPSFHRGRIPDTELDDRCKRRTKAKDIGRGFIVETADPYATKSFGRGLQLQVLRRGACLEVNVPSPTVSIRLLVGEGLDGG